MNKLPLCGCTITLLPVILSVCPNLAVHTIVLGLPLVGLTTKAYSLPANKYTGVSNTAGVGLVPSSLILISEDSRTILPKGI